MPAANGVAFWWYGNGETLPITSRFTSKFSLKDGAGAGAGVTGAGARPLPIEVQRENVSLLFASKEELVSKRTAL